MSDYPRLTGNTRVVKGWFGYVVQVEEQYRDEAPVPQMLVDLLPSDRIVTRWRKATVWDLMKMPKQYLVSPADVSVQVNAEGDEPVTSELCAEIEKVIREFRADHPMGYARGGWIGQHQPAKPGL